MEKIYGYIRVSSRDQNEERQRIAMRNFGIPKEQVYFDKQSGKDFERPEYQRLIARLNPNDTLVVKSIDRLGRNYTEILNQWHLITKEKRANIVVIDMPLLDTRKSRDLMGMLISDIVLQVLSYVSQTEREFIHQRQAEGIAAAKARGVRFGRRAIKQPVEFESVYEKWQNGELSARSAAKQLGVSPNTFLKWAKSRIL